MPNTREKLIELLESAESAIYWDSSDKNFIEKIADHLIANGVTFAKDNNVPSKWIPVTERLPNHWEDVLVRLQCGDCVVAVRSGLIWRVRWNNTLLDREPTHWMPLPEPPKGEGL